MGTVWKITVSHEHCFKQCIIISFHIYMHRFNYAPFQRALFQASAVSSGLYNYYNTIYYSLFNLYDFFLRANIPTYYRNYICARTHLPIAVLSFVHGMWVSFCVHNNIIIDHCRRHRPIWIMNWSDGCRTRMCANKTVMSSRYIDETLTTPNYRVCQSFVNITTCYSCKLCQLNP